MKYCFIVILFFTNYIFSQNGRYTKGTENGYAWLSMDDPALNYSVSKENYLSSVLERIRITKEKYPEISSLSCKEDISELSINNKSKEISMADVVNEIDNFYSIDENLIIPIIFAYCYTIKKLAGVKNEELDIYRNDVILFCYE